MLRFSAVVGICVVAGVTSGVQADVPTIYFVSSSTNDFVTAAQLGNLTVKIFPTISDVLAAAAPGDALLATADDMVPINPGVPQTNTTVNISDTEWASIDKLQLKVYLEFPSSLPPSSRNSKVGSTSFGQTVWERIAVSKTGGMGTDLGYLDLLHPHKHVDYVQLPSTLLPSALLTLGVMAGYDNASYGLPTSGSFPLLVAPTSNVLVAATQLSHCRSRRFAPTARWMALTKYVLDFVSGGKWTTDPNTPLWTPSVTASFSRDEDLPDDAEKLALQRGVQFYRNSMLLPNVQRAVDLGMMVPTLPDFSFRQRQYARLSGPYFTNVSGDGQLGVFEGLTSDIDIHGEQPQSNGVRADCVLETSAAFAARGVVTANDSDIRVATNLLNYGHIHSGFHQPWALGSGVPNPSASVKMSTTRPWVVSGDAFGIKSWTTLDVASSEFYSDDDARGLLGAIATAGLLKSDRWDTTIATGVLGNLRQTPQNGFCGSSYNLADLVDSTTFSPESGWRSRYDSEGGSPNFSPHYESYIWAAYLWAYSRSGFQPLLDRAQTGLRLMMENYPTKWIPTANGIAMQRARILLPLAFLVRANDTALHRQWLQTAIDGFLTRQHCENDWCAFREEVSCPGWGGSTRVPNNDDYGTFEAPLNQENDDPVSDFLYTSNFALLGLHEAAAALNNATVKDIEDRLAKFLIRIQARSTEQPRLDGAFMRAFDYEKWEAWASDADLGWGAWSVESGWTQSWITITFGMRLLNVSLWDLGARFPTVDDEFKAWIPIMFPPAPAPVPSPCASPLPCVSANASGQVEYTLTTNLEPLCASSSTAAHVHFTGTTCGNDGGYIQWNTMKTLDPRSGVSPADCEWTRDGNPGDVPQYFGSGCGVCPIAVTIPTTVCKR